jgi:hypothetical protein
MMAQDAEVSPAFQPLVGVAAHLGGLIEVSGPSHDPGRRVTTLCKDEDGLRQQLALYQAYYNFCLPHTSLRQPLPQPVPTNGTGSAKTWQPYTPAMAAGLTDQVWSLRDMLLYRVPPWPQPGECKSKQQGWETAGKGRLKWRVRPHGRGQRLPQGSEGRWEAMRALVSRPFCPCDGRRVRLRDLSARSRYKANPTMIEYIACKHEYM